nr:hypothetical protein [Tanacetum cinerariifolium]
MDLDVVDVSSQPPPKQMEKGFTATAYLKVQENLKLTVKEQVILEEPASSSGTLSSLKHLTKDLSFGDLFFSDKPSKANNDKATAETKASSMVSVTIQQDTSLIHPMTTPIIDLTSRHESPKVHQLLKATATETATTILPPLSQQQQSNTDAMMMKRIGELEHIMANLIQENKRLEQRLDSHGALPPPPPPPPSTNQEGQSKGSAAPSSSKTAASAEYQAWTTTDIRLRLSISLTPVDLQMDYGMAPDEQAQSSDDEDIGNAHIPKTGDIAMFMDCFYKRRGITKLKPQDLEGPAFEIIKVVHPNVIHFQYQMEECHKLLTESVDDSILRQNGSRPALSISKMKAAYYPDVGLEQMVPQMWIEEECKHTSEGDCRAVRTHMRILSVVKIEVFSMYSDGTLHQIDEALDYRVKEFKINRMNPGLNTRFWTRKDVDRSKEFMFAIQKRLKTRIIFRNLESFKKKSRDSPKTPPGSPPHQPPPPPPPAGPSGASGSPGASGSSQVPPSPPPLTKKVSPRALPYQALQRQLPQLNIKLGRRLIQDSGRELAARLVETSRGRETGYSRTCLVYFVIRCAYPNEQLGISSGVHLFTSSRRLATRADCVDDSILMHNVSKPLPLGGLPGQVTIQSDFFFNKDLEYLRYSSKGRRPALSISKMKAAYYPDAGLEQMVPNQIAVRTHMRILSVVRIKVFSMYGYDYMKKIVLRRVDLNEHVIAERDFKYLYPNDFQLGIESYQTQLNLTKPRWDATGFEYKHDYTVIDSPRAVTFRDRYGVQMIMHFNEIHKFINGTLQQIDEALDYRVKEFKINRMNPGLNTRF